MMRLNDEMTPLHLLQTLLNLGTKNLCSWGTSLGNDEGQEQNLDDALWCDCYSYDYIDGIFSDINDKRVVPAPQENQ